MAVIDIVRHHSLDHDHAIEVANRLARTMERDYQLKYEWDGDTLHCHRSGVHGEVRVRPQEIRVHLKLGFLLRPFKGRIEREIEDQLSEIVGG